MNEIKEKNDIQYLEYSEKWLQEAHDEALKGVKTCKAEIIEIMDDMKNIKSVKLRNACAQAHDGLMKQKSEFLTRIRETVNDLKHVRSILKTLKKNDKVQK